MSSVIPRVTSESVSQPSPTATSMVHLRSVTKLFEDVRAVNNLTLAVETGEFFSLLGPSGCGKTTTLRMIGGFETPSAGEILLDGKEVSNVPPYRRDVNTVFQSYALFPHLNVYDNLAFGLKQHKVPREEIKRRVRESLELVSLAGMEKRKPSQLSGGQQQRVALARALINHPKVLLLDEPLGALDARLRKQMQLELKRIQQEVGITFIYVTHDQEEALTMSDRLAVMQSGVIEQVGRPQTVYDRPTTEFVANFLGASNLLPGVVSDKSSQTVHLSSGQLVRASGDFPANGTDVKIGVRPEKLRLEPEGAVDAAGWNSVPGIVQVATYVGVSYQYTVSGPGDTIMTVFSQNTGTGRVPQAGEHVQLMWLPEHSFVIPVIG